MYDVKTYLKLSSIEKNSEDRLGKVIKACKIISEKIVKPEEMMQIQQSLPELLPVLLNNYKILQKPVGNNIDYDVNSFND